MDIVNILPIPLQRNALAKLTLVALLGDLHLDKYMIKHSWFCPRQILCYCMATNRIQTLKVLLNHKDYNFDISEYHFLKSVGHAIMHGHFDALYIYLRHFIQETSMYQSKIWRVCEKIGKYSYYTRYKPKKHLLRSMYDNDNLRVKLEVFYEMMIRVMQQHDKLNEFMWEKLDVLVLSPIANTTSGIFQRLLRARMLDTFLTINVKLNDKFYFVPIELIDTLLRLNLPITNRMIERCLYENAEHMNLETLEELQNLGYLSNFECEPIVLSNLLRKAPTELFIFLGNYASTYTFSLLNRDIIMSRNIELWKYIHEKFPKKLFDDVTIDLHDVYTIPNDTDKISSPNAPFIIEFLNTHKIIVNANLHEWLMLAIDANDVTMATQLLQYLISKDDVLRPLNYSKRLGRKCIEQIIISKFE